MKVTLCFCLAFKIPDDPTATINKDSQPKSNYKVLQFETQLFINLLYFPKKRLGKYSNFHHTREKLMQKSKSYKFKMQYSRKV